MLVLILVCIFYSHSTPINQVINERDILGTQLIRRNDELALLYEKLKIQQSTLKKVRTGRMRVRGEPGRAGPGRAGARARRAPTPFFLYGQELFSKHSSSARALFLVAAEWRIGARTADGRPVVQWQEDGSVFCRRVCVCPEALAVNTPPPPVLTTFRSLAINRNPRGPLFPLHLSRNMHPAALPTGI